MILIDQGGRQAMDSCCTRGTRDCCLKVRFSWSATRFSWDLKDYYQRLTSPHEDTVRMESNNNVAALLHGVTWKFFYGKICTFAGPTLPGLENGSSTLCRPWYSPLCRLLWSATKSFFNSDSHYFLENNGTSWSLELEVFLGRDLREPFLLAMEERFLSQFMTVAVLPFFYIQNLLLLLWGRCQPNWLWASGALQVRTLGTRGMDWAWAFWAQRRGKGYPCAIESIDLSSGCLGHCHREWDRVRSELFRWLQHTGRCPGELF